MHCINGDISASTKSHCASALCHVLTWYKVKVIRQKQQTGVFSFFYLSAHRSTMQQNRITMLKNSASGKKHVSITSSALCHFAMQHLNKTETGVQKILMTYVNYVSVESVPLTQNIPYVQQTLTDSTVAIVAVDTSGNAWSRSVRCLMAKETGSSGGGALKPHSIHLQVILQAIHIRKTQTYGKLKTTKIKPDFQVSFTPSGPKTEYAYCTADAQWAHVTI